MNCVNKSHQYQIVIESRLSVLPVNLSESLRTGIAETTSYGRRGYVTSLSLACAPEGKYRVSVTGDPWNVVDLEIVGKSQQMYHDWEHLNKIIPVKIRYRNRHQKRQIIIKWDKWWVDCQKFKIYKIYEILKNSSKLLKQKIKEKRQAEMELWQISVYGLNPWITTKHKSS